MAPPTKGVDSDRLSPWWNEVTSVGKYESMKGGSRKWECKHCHATKSGGVDRVRAHLLGVRNKGISVCPSISAAAMTRLQTLATRLDGATARQTTRDPRAGCGTGRGGATSTCTSAVGSAAASRAGLTDSSSSKGIGRQSSLVAAWHPGKRAQVDAAVSRFFYGAGVPLVKARDPYFIDMLKEVANFGSSYTPPSSEALRTNLLQAEKSAIEQALTPIRDIWQKCGVTIIGDGWSDNRNHTIQGIIAYSRGRSYFLKAVDNSEGGKTAERLATIWAEAIEYVGAHNVVQFVADGENANRAAGRIIENRYPHICFTPCMAHGLNNLLKDVARVGVIQRLIEKAIHIVAFITRHHYILAVFRRMSPLDLLKYSETRFAYNFLMLQRLFKVRHPLRQLVVSEEWDSWREHNSDGATFLKETCLSDVFWEAIDSVLQIAKPIIIMLRLLDGEEPCIGKVYEGMDRMIESIESIQVLADHLKVEVKTLATSRWTEYHSPLEAAAFVLDPEFQGKGQETDKEVVQGWENILRRFVHDGDDRRKVREELSFYRQKRGLFGLDDAQNDRFKISCTRWWEDYGAETPLLQNLAIRILSQGASSSPCERLWSSFGHIASKRRNKLGVQKANDLVFVNANLRLLMKFRDACSPEPFIGFTYNNDDDDIDLPQDIATYVQDDEDVGSVGDVGEDLGEDVGHNVGEDVGEDVGAHVGFDDYVDDCRDHIGSR